MNMPFEEPLKTSPFITAQEKEVWDLLAKAANAYFQLPVQHGTEPDEFAWSIHRLQDLIAIRIARAACPDVVPTSVVPYPVNLSECRHLNKDIIKEN